ncbi:copper resistance CopC/CopD family protein [Paenibacillus abyssi]|uniref:Copper transport protein YcnJ n=1 Tax=Paenibacillus abyssi TaxID=1340531 RepID=A0A917CWY5_9BACL|nr:copper resistance protein CopC [Paenibacillus abyssi]GGF99584.1 copper transport protein YcnJ [Paenibacillus abyssi]
MLFLTFISIWSVTPQTANAHASAVRFVPEPNSRLDTGPSKAEIQFNEAVEPDVGALQVLDSMSRLVTESQHSVSEDRQTLSIDLPKLGEGVYTVAYSVVSEDGHPVSGSYIFVVGNPPAAKDASSFNPHDQLGHSGHEVATQMTTEQFVIYAVRGIYYAALLLSTGLMLWYALLKHKNEVQLAMFRKWGLWTVRALLISSLLYVFTHSRELMAGQPSSDWARLFTQTEIGMTWGLLIVLALLGFVMLRANAALRVVWAAALLVLEGFSGHAAAYAPKWYSLSLGIVHLIASAVWAGGLAFLLVLWFEERKDAGRFASKFTNAAWTSIVLLTFTGVLSAVLFIPNFSYLFYTSWGTLLIAKTVLVLLVIVVGALLRRRVRRGDLPANIFLRIDAALMALIIVIVGIFTYISPLPANEPVSKHLMGEKMHLTLRITPNVPGDNEFMVKVWLPEETGVPKSVRLLLSSEDRKNMGPIEVPIKPVDDDEIGAFTGFVRATYQAEGPYIPFPGRWVAEIKVLDKEDNELTHQETFRNY